MTTKKQALAVDILEPQTQKADFTKQELINTITKIKSYVKGDKQRKHQIVFGKPAMRKIDFGKINENELEQIYKYYVDIKELSNAKKDAVIKPFESKNMEVMKVIKFMDDKFLHSAKERTIDQSKVHEHGEALEHKLTKFVSDRLKKETAGSEAPDTYLPQNPIYNVQLDDAKKEEGEQTQKQQKEINMPVFPQYKSSKQVGLERLRKYKEIQGMEELEKLHKDMLYRYEKPKLFIQAYEEAKKRLGASSNAVDIKNTQYAQTQNAKVEKQAKSNKPQDESLTSQMGSVDFRQDQGMNVGMNQLFSNQQIYEQKNEQEQKDDMFAQKGSMSAEAVVGTANDLANPVAQAVRQAQLQQFQPQSPNPANVFNVNRRIPVANILKGQQQAPNQVINQQPIANPARQRPTYKSYSPVELQALYNMKEKEKRNAKVEADAGAEQDKTIGDRAKIGLGTYEMKPAADVVLKSNADKKKSIHNFANLNWVESRSDSKLGEFSSLKKMIDGEERMRFSHTYRSTNTLPKSQPVMYNKNHAFFKNYLENRMTPMSIANIQQERQPMTQESNQRDGRRPVGARPWTLTDLGDYTYNHNGVVGTQNLGMTPMYMNERKTDYKNNTTVFPDTIVDVPDDKLESI